MCQCMRHWSYFYINRRDYHVIFSIFRQCANNSICYVFTVTLWTSTDFLSTTIIKYSLFSPYLQWQLTSTVTIISCLKKKKLIFLSQSCLNKMHAGWTLNTVMVQSYLWWFHHSATSIPLQTSHSDPLFLYLPESSLSFSFWQRN